MKRPTYHGEHEVWMAELRRKAERKIVGGINKTPKKKNQAWKIEGDAGKAISIIRGSNGNEIGMNERSGIDIKERPKIGR